MHSVNKCQHISCSYRLAHHVPSGDDKVTLWGIFQHIHSLIIPHKPLQVFRPSVRRDDESVVRLNDFCVTDCL